MYVPPVPSFGGKDFICEAGLFFFLLYSFFFFCLIMTKLSISTCSPGEITLNLRLAQQVQRHHPSPGEITLNLRLAQQVQRDNQLAQRAIRWRSQG